MRFVENPRTVLRCLGKTSLGRKYQVIGPNGLEIEAFGREAAADAFTQMLLGSNESYHEDSKGKDQFERAVLNCQNKNEIKQIRMNLMYVVNETYKYDQKLSNLFFTALGKFEKAAGIFSRC